MDVELDWAVGQAAPMMATSIYSAKIKTHSIKWATENSMVGTQIEASLGEGTVQDRLGLHTPLLRYWSFSVGRCSPSHTEMPPRSGQEGWVGLCLGKGSEGDCRGTPVWSEES